jgi:hypothetical protein
VLAEWFFAENSEKLWPEYLSTFPIAPSISSWDFHENSFEGFGKHMRRVDCINLAPS